MRIRDLIKDINPIEIKGDLDLDVDNIVYDSRKVKENSFFICIDGFKIDGHQFIAKAIRKGARAILIEKKLANYDDETTYIRVNDSREAMSYLAATFYNYPLAKLKLIGVTGTNGKTTTTYLIKAILEEAGYKTGLIGTIKNIIGNKSLPATRTTPESLDLYHIFAEMVEAGISYTVMEVSSHALDLKRVMGMNFKIGIFTNITQDHLDYHKSIAEYLKVKSILFSQLEEDGYALINLDDPHSSKIMEAAQGKIFTYAIKQNGDLRADRINLTPQGVSFMLKGKTELQFNLKLTGLFNVYNALAAISCGQVLGLNDQLIKKGLEKVNGVPGRFELVNTGQDFAVIVDYAHTPDGMKNVLKTALEFVQGKIIVVFGCGGDRDKGKRPLMGQMGARYGDFCVLTSDNPRSEDPLLILHEIEAGIKALGNKVAYRVIPDRQEAISYAINLAQRNDMVIIFGKGHETYQIFRDKTIPFDDRDVARKVLQNRLQNEVN